MVMPPAQKHTVALCVPGPTIHDYVTPHLTSILNIHRLETSGDSSMVLHNCFNRVAQNCTS